MARIVLLGIGNVLMGDDAAGPTAVKLLEAGWEFSPEVEVIESGTPGLDIASLIEGAEAFLVVDAVRARGDPGEIRLLDEAALLGRAPGLSLSPHEPGLREALVSPWSSPADGRGGSGWWESSPSASTCRWG